LTETILNKFILRARAAVTLGW